MDVLQRSNTDDVERIFEMCLQRDAGKRTIILCLGEHYNMDIKVNNTKQIVYGELENGMIVWLQGVRFTASEVTKTFADNAAGNPSNDVIVRFTGKVLSDHTLVNTAYDGGRYGGYSWVTVTVEV